MYDPYGVVVETLCVVFQPSWSVAIGEFHLQKQNL